VSGRPPSATSPWGGVELLERAIGYTRGSLALVTPALLPAPTPCARWDLRALLSHMLDSLTSLHEAGSVRRVRVGVSGGVPVDVVDALRAGACQLLADWSDGWIPEGPAAGRLRDVLVEGRPLTSRVLTSAGALEVAVHGWDVSVACGVPRPIPDALASDLLRVAPVLVTEVDRPSRFGPALAPPADASRGQELLAFLGRSPLGW
jgi:uncharacterized protein (TIGR03086 family)